jgi:hypothetical protein
MKVLGSESELFESVVEFADEEDEDDCELFTASD